MAAGQEQRGAFVIIANSVFATHSFMLMRSCGKRALVTAVSLVLVAASACGGGSGTTKSNLTMRAFVSDDIDGSLHIEDARRDVESGFRISAGANPGTMVLTPDKTITLVFNSGQGTLSVVTNATETVAGRVFLPDISTSYVPLSDDATAFAALPNSTTCGTSITATGCIEVLDIKTNFNITQSIIVNSPSTLVLSPDEKKLLAFAAPASQSNSLTVVDTALAKSSPGTAATVVGGFDRPVWAVFSADSSKAIVINCGPECGGSTASVTLLDMTTSPPTPTTNVPIPGGASTALGVGNNLFVAGTAAGQGHLSVLNPNSLGPPTTVVVIGDGFHNHMEMGSNNQLFVGAITCPDGCLTIFDTTTSTAVIRPEAGDVTGIAPISNRNVVYVIETVLGNIISPGELRIYDTTTKDLTAQQIDVVGRAVDVKYVDK